MLPFLFTVYNFFKSIFIGFRNKEFRKLFYVVVGILVTGMWFYHSVEHWTWLNALYFSVTELTTVGSDLHPQRNISKLFTMLYIFVGFGALFGFLTTIATGGTVPTGSAPSTAAPSAAPTSPAAIVESKVNEIKSDQ